jgi:hypothetical protein
MRMEVMWKALWQKWTIDKPALLGDWLWDVFVVQLAAFLDRLTLRQVVALIPVLILLLAYYHDIPLHPGLMLLGDLFAYIDIFAVLFALSVLSHATTVLFVLKQVAARAGELATSLMARARRLDFRHRREPGSGDRKRMTGRPRSDDGEPVMARGLAWA